MKSKPHGIYAAPAEVRRAYMREAKRRSREAIRKIDPDYDRNPRKDIVRGAKRAA